jgi:hypothetical protein
MKKAKGRIFYSQEIWKRGLEALGVIFGRETDLVSAGFPADPAKD